jgi:hypothetical protein
MISRPHRSSDFEILGPSMHVRPPEKWTVRSTIRFATTTVVGAFVIVIAEENVRHLAEEKHWNEFLTWGLSAMPDLTPILDTHGFWFLFGLATGISAALWIVKYFPERRVHGQRLLETLKGSKLIAAGILLFLFGGSIAGLGATLLVLGTLLNPSEPEIASPEPATQKAAGPPGPVVISTVKPAPPPEDVGLQAPSPIEWRDLNDVDNIFGFNDSWNDTALLISVFRFIGINRTNEPITKVSAWIVTQLTKSAIILGFVNYKVPNKDHILPTGELFVEPGAEFSIAYIIPPTDPRNTQGVTLDGYFARYGGFTLFVEYEFNGQQQFTYEFPYKTINAMLEDKQRKWIEQHKKPPGVREYSKP